VRACARGGRVRCSSNEEQVATWKFCPGRVTEVPTDLAQQDVT
jgi:hypothetical protein